ncbi:MAG: GNAT family N-acetyltransferase [Chloroflexi bacterium]|nr:GNAT family N-acetyltransferase [Chloroflexota bacterium]
MNDGTILSTFPVLETKRLMLRELKTSDARALFRFLSDKEVMRYYDRRVFSSLEEVQRNIERHRFRFERNEGIRWGITIKGRNEVVGNCGYFWDWHDFRGEISYVLARAYWNRGIMTEALTALIYHGFELWPLHRIEANVSEKNIGSMRVLQKLGFREEGTRRERLFEDNEFHDQKMFALLRSDINFV